MPNRICAVAYSSGGPTLYQQYLYDAEGLRVGKASISAAGFPAAGATCAAPGAASGFSLTNEYLLDQGGDQVTELNGSGVWQHSNVWAGAHLEATYDTAGVHFQLSDPLGTRRIETTAAGVTDGTYQSLPFGDNEVTIGHDATENHFTGKERDSESGLDYFGARYYGSNMGRFMSPDWASNPQAVPYASYTNPQTLNLYNYMRNNPLSGTDPDGHCGGPNDPCSNVTVEAKVAQTPKMEENKEIKDGDGKVIAKATGVAGKLVDTVKVDGKPTPGVKVTESNQDTITKNGTSASKDPIEGHGTTNANGQVGDTISINLPTDGTAAKNTSIEANFSNNAWTSTDKQTLTLTLPSGQTCSATSTRTLTNAGGNGYTLTTTQPVVTSPQPPQ